MSDIHQGCLAHLFHPSRHLPSQKAQANQTEQNEPEKINKPEQSNINVHNQPADSFKKQEQVQKRSKAKAFFTDIFHPSKRLSSQKAQASQTLDKEQQKQEKDYVGAHNQLVDSIENRNQAQGQLTAKAINLGTSDASIQRVGLSVGQNNTDINQTLGDQLEASTGLGRGLGNGFLAGVASTKAQKRGMTPEQYTDPTAKDYIHTGTKMVGMTGDVAKTVYNQTQVTNSNVHFGQAANKLKNTRMARLAQNQGTLRAHQNGKILSGSYQASSPEALAAALDGTTPASNISKTDIALSYPSAKSLLPPEAPAKLASEPVVSKAEQQMTAAQKVEKELAERDQRIEQLDTALRKEDPSALQQARHQRDYYQGKTVIDGIKGVASTPWESATVGTNYLLNQLPDWSWKPHIDPERVKQAEQAVGYSVGQQMGSGNAEKMLQEQVQVESLHAKGKPTARALRDLHKQKVMEQERDMSIDEDGSKFYDAYESVNDRDTSERQYEQAARHKLPRPEDQLYLDEEMTHVVPGVMEGISRGVNFLTYTPVDETKK